MIRKRKKKSGGGFRRRALKSARTRKAKELRLRMNSYTAERIPLTRGGYAPSGRYFGSGPPLYEIYNDDERLTGYVRASSSQEAKEEAVKRPGHWGIRNY